MRSLLGSLVFAFFVICGVLFLCASTAEAGTLFEGVGDVTAPLLSPAVEPILSVEEQDEEDDGYDDIVIYTSIFGRQDRGGRSRSKKCFYQCSWVRVGRRQSLAYTLSSSQNCNSCPRFPPLGSSCRNEGSSMSTSCPGSGSGPSPFGNNHGGIGGY